MKTDREFHQPVITALESSSVRGIEWSSLLLCATTVPASGDDDPLLSGLTYRNCILVREAKARVPDSGGDRAPSPTHEDLELELTQWERECKRRRHRSSRRRELGILLMLVGVSLFVYGLIGVGILALLGYFVALGGATVMMHVHRVHRLDWEWVRGERRRHHRLHVMP